MRSPIRPSGCRTITLHGPSWRMKNPRARPFLTTNCCRRGKKDACDKRGLLAWLKGGASRLFFLLLVLDYEPTRLAATLIDIPRIATLNRKLSTDCASTSLRIALVITLTSEVCAATAIVNEKSKKSQ